MAEDLVRDLIARADQMAADRATWEGHWDEVREFLASTAPLFQGVQVPGAKVGQKIFDNSGEFAGDLLAAALHGSLVSPAARWFGIKAQDEAINRDEAAALWLEQCTETMYGAFTRPRGNFAAQIHETFIDLVQFGTAGIYAEERLGNGILFSSRPLKELYIAENSEGRIDTVYRRFKMTARQAVQEWGEFQRRGLAQLPEAIAKAAEDATSQDKEFEFLHAVYPRRSRDPRRRDARNMPIASCVVCITEKALVRESGYWEMPFAVPRWTKRSGEIYGRGPGMKALADVKLLQRAMRVTIRGVEKIVDPALLAADDGVISNEIRTAPSAINYVRAELLTGQAAPIRPLLTGGRPDLAEEFMAGIRQRIEAAFYYNLIQVMRDPKMTATQVIQLAEEVRRILGPVLGRLEVELLEPLILRVFGILFRAGAFPPPPDILRGRKLVIEYVSPIAKAQRATEAQAIMRTVTAAAELSALKPDVVDNFDLDGAARRLADHFGYPKDLQRSFEVVQQIRAQRSAAHAEAAEGEAVARDIGVAADAVRALPALRQALSPTSAVAGNA